MFPDLPNSSPAHAPALKAIFTRKQKPPIRRLNELWRASSFWGAHPSRVLAKAPRFRELLPQKAPLKTNPKRKLRFGEIGKPTRETPVRLSLPMNFNKFIGVPRKPPLLEVSGQAEQASNLQGPMKNGRSY